MKTAEQIKKMLHHADDQIHQQWLTRFAQGELSEVEKVGFVDFVNESSDFLLQTAVAGYQDNVHHEDDIKMLKRKYSPAKKISNSPVVLLRIAAIFVLILSIGVGYYFYLNKYLKEDILVDNPGLPQNNYFNNQDEETSEKVSVQNHEQKNDAIIKEETQSEVVSPVTRSEPSTAQVSKEREEIFNKRAQTLSERKDEVSVSNQADDLFESDEKEVILDNLNKNYPPSHSGNVVVQSAPSATQTGVAMNESRVSRKAISETAYILDQKASYPGGEVEMKKFIEKQRKSCFNSTHKSVFSADPKVKLKIQLKSDGAVSRVIVINSLTDECDAEAKRIVQLMTPWIPAYKNGKKVKDEVEIEINFN